ncbi:hypothetical protein ABPG75_001121 [Micractinium tetrahymenae]
MTAILPRRRLPLRLIAALAAAVCLSAAAWVHSGGAWASISSCYTPVAVPLVSAAFVPPPLVLPAEQLGDVFRYSLPGEFAKVPPATDEGVRAGILHIYLKALRWPMPDGSHHLRARGFLAFEFTSAPAHWTCQYTFHNVPEVAHAMRLYVIHHTLNWQREIAVEFSFDYCERQAWANKAGFDYTSCVAALAAQRNRTWYNLGDIDLDFGIVLQGIEGSNFEALDFDLRVDGWPRRANLKAQLAAALRAPPADAGDRAASGPPAVLRALPYFYNSVVDADKTAWLLRWSDEYHATLGFSRSLLYVLPRDAAAFEAHPGIRALVEERRLALVLWDQHAGFAEFRRWKDFELQIVESHATLSFWGRNAHVLVIDSDEFFVPAEAGQTLTSMMSADGCLGALPHPECIVFPRFDIFLSPEEADQDEPSLWNRTSGGSPLPAYQLVSHVELPTKVMVDPAKTMSPNVHYTSVCTGTPSIVSSARKTKLQSACGTATRAPCSRATASCAWLAHVGNMHKARKSAPANAASIQPTNWLWMLEGGR